ncbi:hypothetical protein DQ04_07801010 [Trypanosoma grayi]|uniref:hypothetical protein n=1 Tax=Trypanosoma grayi TaxID=71804 RepID=UPI0004F43365|nr:hypothetical protein DQ04_07801010 [Trypanosoma grayi]KEG08186.1 hypothetical protein DQ04_07801010 [Trypanosoma grayi]
MPASLSPPPPKGLRDGGTAEEVFIHPSVALTVVSSSKLEVGADGPPPPFGFVHATAVHPYVIRLRSTSTSTCVVYRVMTKHSAWWEAEGTHGVLHPPKEFCGDYDEGGKDSAFNDGDFCGTKEETGVTVADKDTSVAYVSLRVQAPLLLDKLYDNWREACATAPHLNPALNKYTAAGPGEVVAAVVQGRKGEGEGPPKEGNVILPPSPLPDSYKRGSTTTSVDVLSVLLAELPASHALLRSPHAAAPSPADAEFNMWWKQVVAAADVYLGVKLGTESQAGHQTRWKRKKHARRLHTVVTVFPLPVKLAFLSQWDYIMAQTVVLERRLSTLMKTKASLQELLQQRETALQMALQEWRAAQDAQTRAVREAVRNWRWVRAHGYSNKSLSPAAVREAAGILDAVELGDSEDDADDGNNEGVVIHSVGLVTAAIICSFLGGIGLI